MTEFCRRRATCCMLCVLCVLYGLCVQYGLWKKQNRLNLVDKLRGAGRRSCALVVYAPAAHAPAVHWWSMLYSCIITEMSRGTHKDENAEGWRRRMGGEAKDKRIIRIGDVELSSPFLMAPLAGITDSAMRTICHRFGAALTYTEMVSAKGLWYGDKNTGKLLAIGHEEGPVGFQIFGHEPEVMAAAARELDGCGNALLDINMGCPVPKVVKNGEGSALLKNPDLIFDLVRITVQNTSKPVTVKIRAGWDERSINAVETAHAAEAGGAAAIAIHGRTREQFYSGKADRSVIAAVKRAVSIPVIGNGDVFCADDGLRMMKETGCDMVLVARGALGNPWIFRELGALWRGEETPPPPTKEERKALMLEHMDALVALKGEYVAIREMRKQVGWYLKGIQGAAAFRGIINKITAGDALREAILGI